MIDNIMFKLTRITMSSDGHHEAEIFNENTGVCITLPIGQRFGLKWSNTTERENLVNFARSEIHYCRMNLGLIGPDQSELRGRLGTAMNILVILGEKI